jgi:hypothetical protein
LGRPSDGGRRQSLGNGGCPRSGGAAAQGHGLGRRGYCRELASALCLALVLRVRVLPGRGRESRRPGPRHGDSRRLHRDRDVGQKLRASGRDGLLRRRKPEKHLSRTPDVGGRAAGRRRRARCRHRGRGRGRTEKAAAWRGRRPHRLKRRGRRLGRWRVSHAGGTGRGCGRGRRRPHREGRRGAGGRKARGGRWDVWVRRWRAGGKEGACGEGPGAAACARGCCGRCRRGRRRASLRCPRGARQNALEGSRFPGARRGRCARRRRGWRPGEGEVAGRTWVVGRNRRSRRRGDGTGEAARGHGPWRRRRCCVRRPQLKAGLAGWRTPVQGQVAREEGRRPCRGLGRGGTGGAVAQKGQLRPTLQTLRHGRT